MKTEAFSKEGRRLRKTSLKADLVVVGGGVAGTCAALAAAREGLKVVLVQDRPVLGGNGSSEVRLWWLGATCHGMTNNRWAREPGIVNELMLENLYRNKEGNPVLVDLVLLDKVKQESAITLLLNTAVDGCEKSDDQTISRVTAFCAQNSTRYEIKADLFCDASGDGILGFMAGAAFRMGAEKPEEFNEPLAPGEDFGELLGDSIYFYTKDTGHPVSFKPPSFIRKIHQDDIRMLRYFTLQQQGCQLWWIESGGRFDTVHEAERIKWDLWAIVYGVWDYIKNSGDFPDSENLTLEWVGSIPGKRESRRFEGDKMLSQADLIEAKHQADVVGFGGWAIDLHPADGAFSELPPAIQYHVRRLYPIPYSCLYSRNIKNLFLGGRTLSTSHVAFGSVRVMSTLGQLGEVIGRAASLALKNSQIPASLDIEQLQKRLLKSGFHLPRTDVSDTSNLSAKATSSASSTWALSELPGGELWMPLRKATAQMIPLDRGELPEVTLELSADTATQLEVIWARASLEGSHTPDSRLGSLSIGLKSGKTQQRISIQGSLPEDGYAFLMLGQNEAVSVRLSDQHGTGMTRLVSGGTQREGDSHSDYLPAEQVGCEAFDLWYRDNRPKFAQRNLAFSMSRSFYPFAANNVLKHPLRPTILPNAWVADPADTSPSLNLSWPSPQRITSVTVYLDPDWDHPLETVIKEHPRHVMPSLIQNFDLLDDQDKILTKVTENHQAIVHCTFECGSVQTSKITLRIEPPKAGYPAAIFGVSVN